MTAIVFDIQRGSFVDGPGIRTTVFFKGCNLRCRWCHNPESQLAKRELLFYKNICTGCGKCREVCPHRLSSCDLCGRCALFCPADARRMCGEELSVDRIFATVAKDRAYYDASGGGVTASGGECMLQIDPLCELLKMCKENGISTAVDTAGDVPFSSFEKILPYTDLLLYDVKAFTEELHLAGTGVSNVRILDNLKKLSGRKDIIVRVPLIGGFNDTEEEIGKIAAFLAPLEIRSVEVLPYHRLGEHKYTALGRTGESFRIPSKEETAHFSDILHVT